MSRWPDIGVELWSELERAPGRFALVVGDDQGDVAGSLADLRGAVPAHVGRLLTELKTRPSEPQVRRRLNGHPVLVGLEILFDPVLEVDPVRLLARLSRESPPLVAVWPVATSVGPLRYPEGTSVGPGSGEDLQGCLLLTAHPTLFADDAPFTMERFN